MEIMERLVQIKIIFIIVVTLFTTNSITAQQNIDKDITFSFKGKKGYAILNSFLVNFKFDEIIDQENCTTVFGIIKFQITPKGKIASVDTEGNLPDGLINAIKERILLTENHWVFSDSILEIGKNIEFYYPIYIELTDKCNYKIHESYNLLNSFFEDQNVLLVKNDTYFIKPTVWYAAIK